LAKIAGYPAQKRCTSQFHDRRAAPIRRPAAGHPGLRRMPLMSNQELLLWNCSGFDVCHIFFRKIGVRFPENAPDLIFVTFPLGIPVPTPDQILGRLFPRHALSH
jgi:hypothetical protein